MYFNNNDHINHSTVTVANNPIYANIGLNVLVHIKSMLRNDVCLGHAKSCTIPFPLYMFIKSKGWLYKVVFNNMCVKKYILFGLSDVLPHSVYWNIHLKATDERKQLYHTYNVTLHRILKHEI